MNPDPQTRTAPELTVLALAGGDPSPAADPLPSAHDPRPSPPAPAVRTDGEKGTQPPLRQVCLKGTAGEALGSGLVVDLSRHFRAIAEVGADTVRVQPGVTWRDLNARLAANKPVRVALIGG